MSENQTQELTYGQKAVGLTFNPTGSPGVDKIKSAYAAIIDHLNDMRDGSQNPEKKRMASVAITEAQTAQMWAVKSIVADE